MNTREKRFYDFGEFRLDAKKRRLLQNGEPVALTPKEFEVLLLLVENAGRVVEKDELLDKIWADTFVEEGTLTRNVSWLRKKLGASGDGKGFIETLPKRGYRFTAPVVESAEENALVIEEQTLTRITIEETVSLTESEPPAVAGGLMQAETIPATTKNKSFAAASGSDLRNRWIWAAFIFGGIALAAIGFAVRQSFLQKPKTQIPFVGKVKPFSSLPGREDFPAFSPDGKQLTFAWNGGNHDNLDIYVKLIGAGEPLRLTKNEAEEINPTFSPDGRFVAFIRSFVTRSEILVVPALGGAERRICEARSTTSSLSWSPNGRTLAVADKEAANSNPGIFLVDVESGAKRRLTAPPENLSDNTPRFSPDGKLLAFVRAANAYDKDLFIVEATGGEPRQLTFDKSAINGLSWSADRNIIFASNRKQSSSNLWQIAADGSNEPELVMTGGKNPTKPAVAPDGKTVAFVEDFQDTNIWRIEIDAAGKQISSRKFIESARADHSPNFSPNGKQIAFVSDRTGDYEIWIADADGSNPMQLTHSNGAAAGTPRFSPDGKFIAFDWQIEGKGEIFVISAKGSPPRRLTELPSHDVMPSWSADGRWIYFCSDKSGDLNIWKIPSDGGEVVQITRQGGFEAFESPDGKSVFYSKGRGVAGLWRVSTDGGEESAVAELAEAGYWRYWTMTNKGIYFVVRVERPPYKIKFYNFNTGQTEEIVTMEKTPLWIFPGLAASSDGKSILYSQFDQSASSIILAELGK